ncbi:DUF2510 domain-containing protein [Demequina phytophila]|uniref:DUF2510 domain-containing protein n=1 Tax=Demequina phytophila TaxID=1638981 RepID=UPI00078253CB|nr:DUF2510 domain-containing protein [Demequina phytophila]
MTESMEPARVQPVAGWYVDPLDAGVMRYWDGSGWTAHARPVEPEPEPAPVQRHRVGMAAVLGIIASTLLLGIALVTIAAIAQRERMAEPTAPDPGAVASPSTQAATDDADDAKALMRRARVDLDELGVTIVAALLEDPEAQVQVAEIAGDYLVLTDGTPYATIDASNGVELGGFVPGGADAFCVWVEMPATDRAAHWSPLDATLASGTLKRAGDCAAVTG